jgi:hypothetical protein
MTRATSLLRVRLGRVRNVGGLNSFTSQPLARILAQEEAAFSAASFALASALAAVRAARSECHAAVIYCVNRPNGSASSFVSGL